MLSGDFSVLLDSYTVVDPEASANPVQGPISWITLLRVPGQLA